MTFKKAIAYAGVFFGMWAFTVGTGHYFTREMRINYETLTERVDYWKGNVKKCFNEENGPLMRNCLDKRLKDGLDLGSDLKNSLMDKKLKYQLNYKIENEVEKISQETGNFR